MPFAWIATVVLTLFAASQIYWFFRARAAARRLVRPAWARWSLAIAGFAVYLAMFSRTFHWFGRDPTPIRLTTPEAFVNAPFLWWAASSLVAFLVAGLLALGKPLPLSPERRVLLTRATNVAVAAPFVAGAYGLLYGRLNLEVANCRVGLPRLPAAFGGFRIAQLSDIHIGPFMTEEQIRRFAQIANSVKADMIVLTGDFVTWDPSTAEPVVRALAGLRAPFGVFGCLGNHDAWAGIEDFITQRFGQAGIRILRQERAAVQSGGETLNLLGVDFTSIRRRPRPDSLDEIAPLIAPAGVNILLSHNPDTFDRAAAMGIDLSLAGHTHGGQLALEFISPQIAPSRLVTPYVAGLFRKPGGQLYVNRGIGTIGVPIRLGSRPEITVFELTGGRSSG